MSEVRFHFYPLADLLRGVTERGNLHGPTLSPLKSASLLLMDILIMQVQQGKSDSLQQRFT